MHSVLVVFFVIKNRTRQCVMLLLLIWDHTPGRDGGIFITSYSAWSLANTLKLQSRREKEGKGLNYSHVND